MRDGLARLPEDQRKIPEADFDEAAIRAGRFGADNVRYWRIRVSAVIVADLFRWTLNPAHRTAQGKRP